jgi:hypothetical protein
MSSAQVIVVSAYAPEIAGIRPRPGLHVEALGIGVIEAALGIARLLRTLETQDTPQGKYAFLLLGTVGAYRSTRVGVDVGVGELVTGVSVSLVSHGQEVPRAKTLALSPLPVFRRVRIATTLGITVDNAVASALSEAHDVEHMETYALASAAGMQAHALYTLLGVTNEVGGDGRTQWAKNEALLCEKLGAAANRVIDTLLSEA